MRNLARVPCETSVPGRSKGSPVSNVNSKGNCGLTLCSFNSVSKKQYILDNNVVAIERTLYQAGPEE